MAWFNIQSLFTNTSLDKTIDICLELLFYKKRRINGMLKKHIKEILTHAVKSSTFMFNDLYYNFYTEHTTSVPAIFKFMKKSII